MEEKRYCACGCGGEVKIWKNMVTSCYLRGHHMRKKGWRPPVDVGPHYCKCGCGTEILPLKNGHIRKYIKGHHLKGKALSFEYRIERSRNRWGREPIISPYLKETFISFDKRLKRWSACIRKDGVNKNVMHANAVYREYFGEIPKGYVVHHKNGKCRDIEDDRPENLMLLPDHWNLRFFPVLSKGFGIDESEITEVYESIFDDILSETEMFLILCSELIQRKKCPLSMKRRPNLRQLTELDVRKRLNINGSF